MSEQISVESTTQDNTDVSETTDGVQETTAPETTETKDDSQVDSQAKEIGDDDLMGGSGQEGAEKSPESDKEKPDSIDSYDLKIEEGYELPDKTLQELTEIGKSEGISNEGMQKLFDLSINSQKAQDEAQAKANKEEEQKIITQWRENAKKKYGDKYNEVYNQAKNAYKTFFPEELRGIFKETGFDNNDLFFDTLVKLGKTIGEDSFVQGESSKGSDNAEYQTYSDILPQNPKLGNR
jgi:hypothetical protein